MNKRIVMHIDCNSAYLSWQAAYDLQHGSDIDLRAIPAIVGGDPEKRSGIVLAKSIPAKKCGIHTGEVLWKAMQKCPDLHIVKPNYALYLKSSRAMNEILREYAPHVQQYSIDESFCEFTGTQSLLGDPVELAHIIKNRIKNELGFTVNIGVSTNKLLAKMAGELRKPNVVETIWPSEIQTKLWPLPIGDLFGVGRATVRKLTNQGILTIGDLASADPELIQYKLGKYGLQIWNYANGIEDSLLREQTEVIKGLGNSSTLPRDLDDAHSAHLFLLSLTEMVSLRLRASNNTCGLISVTIRYSDLSRESHQRKLLYQSDNTSDIYNEVVSLFNELWNGNAIRHLGVRVSNLKDAAVYQMPLIDSDKNDSYRKLDSVLDDLRGRFGRNAVMRGSLLHSGFKSVSGGVIDEDYPMMSSLL